MGQPIVHFEIIGKDAPKLQKFYADLFDWQIAPPTGPEMGFHGMVDGASSGIAGGIGQAPDGQRRVSVYVRVPSLQATLDRAVSTGGRITLPPTQIPGGPRIALFADPDGNLTSSPRLEPGDSR